MVKFLHNTAAAVHGKWVIISDLHIGKKDGVGWKATAEIVRNIMEQEKRKNLLILGDVKASVTETEGDAGKFIREIGREYSLHITKGNHDGGIEKYSEYCTVHGAGGAIIYDDGKIGLGRDAKPKIGVMHGHAWPDAELLRCGTIMMGHSHPQLLFGSEIKHSEKVWVIGQLNTSALEECYGKEAGIRKKIRIICVPAFGPWKGWRSQDGSERLRSPLLNENIFIKSSAEIYLLNGIRVK
ncbi:MAG: metallophosphoesterase [Candidatus Micrarchaeia archaeon]